jgi:Tfp pilus assembly protein PilF
LALEVDPDYELSFTGLAAIHHEAGRLKEAISCYQRAIQAHPEYENAHYNLGVLYETTGKWN